jgi:hypothetical protein
LTLYNYYGGGRVAALRFLYQMRNAVGFHDGAMRSAGAEAIRIAMRYGRKPSVEISQ